MFKIVQGNIIDYKGEAIVNSINVNFENIDEASGAICKAAGPRLATDLARVAQCNIGDAFISSSYDMENIKYIIHVIPPIYGKHKDVQNTLRLAYYSALLIAKRYNVKSIAFPHLGIVNNNNCPFKESAYDAIEMLSHFSEIFDMDITLYEESDFLYNMILIAQQLVHEKSKYSFKKDYFSLEESFFDQINGISVKEKYIFTRYEMIYRKQDVDHNICIESWMSKNITPLYKYLFDELCQNFLMHINPNSKLFYISLSNFKSQMSCLIANHLVETSIDAESICCDESLNLIINRMIETKDSNEMLLKALPYNETILSQLSPSDVKCAMFVLEPTLGTADELFIVTKNNVIYTPINYLKPHSFDAMASVFTELDNVKDKIQNVDSGTIKLEGKSYYLNHVWGSRIIMVDKDYLDDNKEVFLIKDKETEYKNLCNHLARISYVPSEVIYRYLKYIV